MSTPLKVWQRWSTTPAKATNPDSNRKGPEMVTPVTGRVSEIQYDDDPRRLPDKISELEKEVGFFNCNLSSLVRYVSPSCCVWFPVITTRGTMLTL